MTHWTIDNIHKPGACVAYGDTFETPAGAKGRVQDWYLSGSNRMSGDTSAIELALGIPLNSGTPSGPYRKEVEEFASKAYGYPMGHGDCPSAKMRDYHALTRLLQACMPRKGMTFVVGKKYPTREGGSTTYKGFTRACDPSPYYATHPHWFVWDSGHKASATDQGHIRPDSAPDPLDIISDTPIVEPLKLEAGKRYRRRDGKITGPLLDRGPTCTYPQSRFRDDALGGYAYWFTGEYRGDKSCDDRDLIEEYVEELYNRGAVGYIAGTATPNSKAPTMTKRTLPTVTLDDIFKAGPCWVTTEGPVAAAQKMAQLVPGGKVSYRTLHELVRDRRITGPEAGWATAHLPALKEGASVPGLRGWGTEASFKALDNWENPPQRTVHDLPQGTQFTYTRHIDGGKAHRWVVLPRDEGHLNRTQILSLTTGVVDAFSGAASGFDASKDFTDIVEPGKPAP